MAKFYVTTNMKNNDKHFQFVFDTMEAASVDELVELLDSGRTVIGSKRIGSGPESGSVRLSLNSSIVGMIQDFVPRPRADADPRA